MKKLFCILFSAFILYFLCSCSQNDTSETYFVHCIGFESDGDGITITALLEKNSQKDGKYFTASKKTDSINEAAKKLMKDYKDCYFATCDTYFITLSENSKSLTKIAKEICDSNIYPTTADIFCIRHNDIAGFMKAINNSEKLISIRQIAKGKRVNTAAFFANYVSGKSSTLGVLSAENDGFILSGTATYNNTGKAVYHHE